MLVHQLKNRIVEGSVYCISKNQSHNSVFQAPENFHFENCSPDRTMVAGADGHYRQGRVECQVSSCLTSFQTINQMSFRCRSSIEKHFTSTKVSTS